MPKKMTAAQKKYFGKGHSPMKKGKKTASKKGSKKMTMKGGKPAFLKQNNNY